MAGTFRCLHPLAHEPPSYLCRANAIVIAMPAIIPARTCLRLTKSPRYFHASLRCFHAVRALING